MDSYLYDGIRTPVARRAGALALVRPDDLIAGCIQALFERSAFQAAEVEDIVLGCTSQAGEDARNVARHAGLLAGLPVTCAGQTVNRLCGSGLSALLSAAHASALGHGELFVAGGVESMSRAPFVIAKSETAFSRETRIFESLGARFSNPRIEQAFGKDSMPQTAENVARELGISRDDADEFALRSQQRYAQAAEADFYDGEILPVMVKAGRGEVTRVTKDEHPRAQTSLDGLAKLKTLVPGGVVTAGNASGVNDGAAALLVGTRAIGRRHGVAPRARILSGAVAGVEPRLMGLGPVDASRKALIRAGLALGDMDVIELNEAFAAQVLGCLKLMGIDYDDERVNPNGGAIAIGHPLGASGARIALTAMRQLERTQGRYALVTMCIGVGQGIAMVIERMRE
ncbi:MAG: 3-oxoadipyl-CoA thiolase [Pigmentiphaga sp.]